MTSALDGYTMEPTPPGGGWRFVPPAPRVVTVPQPAAATGMVWKAPAMYLLRLSLVTVKLVASATVGTRFVVFSVKGPTAVTLTTFTAQLPVGASQTAVFQYMHGGTVTHGTSGRQITILPDITYPPDCTVMVTVTTVKAGDQLSTAALLVSLI